LIQCKTRAVRSQAAASASAAAAAAAVILRRRRGAAASTSWCIWCARSAAAATTSAIRHLGEGVDLSISYRNSSDRCSARKNCCDFHQPLIGNFPSVM